MVKLIKCVVWDLDRTVWDGVLLEDGEVTVRLDAGAAIRGLDGLGVVQSIASRNDSRSALDRLAAAGLLEYFLAPRIGWGAKSHSVCQIADTLNLGLDTVLFVDDDPFERAEVQQAHPEVRVCADATHLLGRPDLPRSATADGSRRRQLYRADFQRADAQRDFTGTSEQFLASLDLRMTIRPATEDDLNRAEELTLRTNQLNATGYTYSRAELAALRHSPDHTLLVTDLTDRFGDYGTVGLALLEHRAGLWTVKLLLVSCRVMSRGIGTVLLNAIIARARGAGARLVGEFVPTDRNRPMLVTYRFAGFAQVGADNGVMVLEHRSDVVPTAPSYLRLTGWL
jgi:FkbH-like protein